MASTIAFRARITLVATADGGRRTAIPSRWMCTVNLGRTFRDQPVHVDARATPKEGQAIAPGGDGEILLEPLSPELWEDVEAGASFTLHEGRRTIGHGEVLEKVWNTIIH